MMKKVSGIALNSQALIILWLSMNIFGFAITAYDKAKAKLKGWRVPEKWFFILAFLGGAWGVWAGMFVFRHKTKHTSFLIGIPLLGVLNVLIIKTFLAL